MIEERSLSIYSIVCQKKESNGKSNIKMKKYQNVNLHSD